MFCVRLADLLGALIYRLDREGRKVSVANIETAFGEQYTASQREVIACKSYQGFARTMIDLFWAPRMTADNYRRFIHVENEGIAREMVERGEGAVFICAHAGAFEWSSIAIGFVSPAMVVTQSFKNPLLNRVFSDLRSSSGQKMIPQEASAVRLLKHTLKGGLAGLLIDLNLKPSQPSVVIDTLGMKMCVTFLHCLLAERAGARLIPVDSRSLPDGTSRVTFHKPLQIRPDSSRKEIAQTCWNFFEGIIKQNPELWIWSYKHWRYRPADADRPYPFYANVSKQFEKLLRVQDHPKRRVDRLPQTR